LKTLFIIIASLLFIGCTESEFTSNAKISKYVNDKYAGELKKFHIYHLKCLPVKDGNVTVHYSKIRREDDFPSTIYISYVNETYQVLFDRTYMNNDKVKLINDIDVCMVEFKRLFTAHSTWN